MATTKKQTARGKAQDKRTTSKKTLPATRANVAKWKAAPNRIDIKGIDTKKVKKTVKAKVVPKTKVQTEHAYRIKQRKHDMTVGMNQIRSQIVYVKDEIKSFTTSVKETKNRLAEAKARLSRNPTTYMKEVYNHGKIEYEKHDTPQKVDFDKWSEIYKDDVKHLDGRKKVLIQRRKQLKDVQLAIKNLK